eukprot:11933616-Alexandrium_andersonii.AAC.1
MALVSALVLGRVPALACAHMCTHSHRILAWQERTASITDVTVSVQPHGVGIGDGGCAIMRSDVELAS